MTGSESAEYTLTGQDIPTGQNVLIRAVGTYRTGYLSGSEAIENNTQAAYILAPSSATVFVSGRIMVGNGAGLTNATVNLTVRPATSKSCGLLGSAITVSIIWKSGRLMVLPLFPDVTVLLRRSASSARTMLK